MSKAKEAMLFWAGIRSWAGAGMVCQCFGVQYQGWEPSSILPWQEQVDWSSGMWKVPGVWD